MSGNKKSPCLGLFVILLFGAQLSLGQEGQSIVGDVLQQRIDQLQDSLFLSEERLDAADLMFIQSARRADSLLTVITSLRDSLVQSRVLHDRVIATNQQNLSRLSALSDSLIQRHYRERALLARNDSLGTLLRQTDEFLKEASAVEGNQADSLLIFQLSMTRLQREIAANQNLLDQMTSDLQVARLTSDGIFIDSTADGNYYTFLQKMLAYEIANRGFSRLFGSSNTDPEVSSFKVDEFQNYFNISGMRGSHPIFSTCWPKIISPPTITFWPASSTSKMYSFLEIALLPTQREMLLPVLSPNLTSWVNFITRSP